MSETLPTLLSAKDVAERLGVTERSVRRWAQEGQLPHLKLAGTVLRFDADAVARWVDDGRVELGA